MDTIHNIVGALVLLAYLAAFAAYLLRFRGQSVPWLQAVSIGAATLLLLQYLIGFSLLSGDHEQVGLHYVFAFLPLLSVGLEHGYARTRPSPREQGLWGMIATGDSFVLLLIAFIIGSANA